MYPRISSDGTFTFFWKVTLLEGKIRELGFSPLTLHMKNFLNAHKITGTLTEGDLIVKCMSHQLSSMCNENVVDLLEYTVKYTLPPCTHN